MVANHAERGVVAAPGLLAAKGADYAANGVSKSFGGVTVLRDVSVHFSPGEIHSLIGIVRPGDLAEHRYSERWDQPVRVHMMAVEIVAGRPDVVALKKNQFIASHPHAHVPGLALN